MFLEVTPQNNPGEKVLVNFNQVKIMMPNDLDDGLGTVLVFEVLAYDKKAGEKSPLGMAILDNYEDLLEQLVGYFP